MRHRASLLPPLLILAAALAACSGPRKGSPDNEPTLRSLAGRKVELPADPGIRSTEEQTIAAYQKFLDVAPRAPQRAEAMRRLGDLEMDLADRRMAEGTAAGTEADFRAAITRYQDYLRAYPKAPDTDRVLYQLARAHEQGGQLEQALAVLDRLVAAYPDTATRDEAHFRRGEILFAATRYPQAEEAYTAVLASGDDTPYRERALYMQGWSRFKQARLDEALASFFGVLDLALAGRGGEAGLDGIEGLSRAERELIEDTFRVASLSLANLQGAESIPPYIDSELRRGYEFRVYEQLAELYLQQERVKDAADTLGAFARRQPLHAQAPVLQARVIDIYQANGFATLALEAKKEYVGRYGVDSEFRRASPEGWERAQPLVKTHLSELARHYHASAQKTKASADYQEAVRWYRLYLVSFPDDPQAPQNHFLLAELLFEDKRHAYAAVEYEKTAYGYPQHARSADAGYSALLSYAELQKAARPEQVTPLKREAVESSLRFAKAFPADPRTGAVLTNAADTLFALNDAERAEAVAQQVLALQPPATDAQRRVAWTVLAHTAFDGGRFDIAERAYGEVLVLTPAQAAGRNELVERQAAAIYKQGEAARDAGRAREAVGHFERIAQLAPQSAVRATAQYDAAAVLIGLKDWDAAARSLEAFRQQHPKHPLQADVPAKLATVYLEQGHWAQAAGEFERVAATHRDPAVAREAQWQAAELHQKSTERGASRGAATRAYERYLQQHPQPLERAVEARYRLAQLAKADGNAAREQHWMREVMLADQRGGNARTDRTRFLGGAAALALAQPSYEAYRQVALVEPLDRNLRLKRQRMEAALKAYGAAAEYGVAGVTTAATYYTAAIYEDFGSAMLKSQRPRRLSKLELEQYEVMLEEQAFPFEEKAMELHEINAQRTRAGIYDEWVQRSFAALAKLRPVRYGKSEKSEGAIDAIR
ncbi:tetratricopeptide repeat protein [Caldimonas caldifontis]|uniref:Outer membrane protein assembly factor BamD n=1 Tax=Caldimonas caldifontis TaxID=1452508 RepID=A0A2S5SXV2_9BURK|nr:tetratricopeptide repeat protein [Caldimonas caldifontis]PPE67459.1 hypothetical protein C1704_04685 [Caldimonas caldifontis]